MGFIEKAVESNDKLKSGDVFCTVCGKTKIVDSGNCLRLGWPKCCGYTMRLGEAPQEELEG